MLVPVRYALILQLSNKLNNEILMPEHYVDSSTSFKPNVLLVYIFDFIDTDLNLCQEVRFSKHYYKRDGN